MPLALLALAIGAFGIGTTEFVIAGLLPEVAADFGVSIPAAGWLITGYALSVAAGALPMTALGTRIRRKHLLLLLMVLFIAGNVLSALAPSFGALMAGRIVAALTHGAFFGVGAVVAADLVQPEKKASAIALMFTGLTLANVLGVPMGTFIGQGLGWRATFWVVAGLGVLGLLGVAALVPDTARPVNARIGAEFAVFRHPRVWLAIGTTVLGFGGVFASFTYIAPMMTEVAGLPQGAVSWLLVLFGVGLVLGNLLGGRFADRALMPTLYTVLAALAVVLAVFAFTAHAAVPAIVTLFLLGGFGFATVPPLQMRMLASAEAAPTVASAVNIGAFNLGNALAAWLGGVVITAGYGYASTNWVGAVMTVLALGLALLSGRSDRRAAAREDRLVTA
ncbi:MFS transporter [Amycolatopsis saalfeldensis]|uniref:MFS transporter, DHA1 family, arabinose polymer transporter n=1 Tax=Amycolatopsis saalfeldensis TaxID=394193 RepID=A0A1H8UPL5_9PSEU|nr:MFS transporter [Amycolatopsis saalfeldensis]SEP04967.1 MFS transporter, DHA1 family, arabinose polymer transporter [Amycolatopsis saalfeldensis]